MKTAQEYIEGFHKFKDARRIQQAVALTGEQVEALQIEYFNQVILGVWREGMSDAVKIVMKELTLKSHIRKVVKAIMLARDIKEL